MLTIGPYRLNNALFLAPMVGVSDTPFREICSELGAGLTIGEMLTSDSSLWHNKRNRLKLVQPQITSPQVVQIAGSDPHMLADAAEKNIELGADAIDINMGCPAKKVLKKAAGSALLRDIPLVKSILRTVVQRVSAPVTLKIRTGWCPQSRNGVELARIAEDHGIRLLAVHGRTRECRFRGQAEYDTIAAIKQAVSIPVIANGDIDSAHKAAQVIKHTGADGVMIGRAAQGRPWLFREIEYFLQHGREAAPISLTERFNVVLSHVARMHRHYGELKGVWHSRKHVTAYLKNLPGANEFLTRFNKLESGPSQLKQLQLYSAKINNTKGELAA
ncbi:MAG: tRNA dihydrouridine synthase DusB [Gammaproteobacteria bacterium]